MGREPRWGGAGPCPDRAVGLLFPAGDHPAPGTPAATDGGAGNHPIAQVGLCLRPVPTIRVDPEHAAVAVRTGDATWAVHCPSCSRDDDGVLGLRAVSLSMDNAQRLADRHNRTVHGITG